MILFLNGLSLQQRLPAGGFRDGDILVLAETAVATSEGNVIRLADITPIPRAIELAEKYDMDPETTEVVLRESDSIVGGIPGFLLCMKGGTLMPECRRGCLQCPAGLCHPAPGKS